MSGIRVINVGLGTFLPALLDHDIPVLDVDFTVPGSGDERTLQLLKETLPYYGQVRAANERAVAALVMGQAQAVRVLPARAVLPDLEDRVILHAGPPLTWERACGPVRGAVMGAVMYEGWATTPEEAAGLVARGHVRLSPCHHHGAVGPMAGVISPSMPVWVVEDQDGRRASATLNEGLGKVLRFGAYSPEVLARLRWIQDVLGPAIDRGLVERKGIDVKSILSRALHMGDEGHNRNVAATSLLVRQLAPALAATSAGTVLGEVLAFLAGNDHFFLNLSMAAAKLAADAAAGVPWSTIVTCMSRNGTDFGLRISAMPDRWFTAPAPAVQGLYFPGYGPADANPDLGDSAITEVAGLGGTAMATAPAIAQFVGGTPGDGVRTTIEMREITSGENPSYSIPALDFSPVPCGFDTLLICRTGITPVINTGIAHREAGMGQVGAGLVRAPLAPFVNALDSFVQMIKKGEFQDVAES
ncbi:MAG: DUF1116 domain-containing protein [Bacillota bacterium]